MIETAEFVLAICAYIFAMNLVITGILDRNPLTWKRWK